MTTQTVLQRSNEQWNERPTEPVGKLKIKNKKFVISFKYAQNRVNAVKEIPGRSYQPATREWVVPINSSSIPYVLDFVLDHNIEPLDHDKFQKIIFHYQNTCNEKQELETDLEINGLGGKLMPFQKAGVAFAAKKKRVLIADEMGLGKTVQALASLLYLKSFPSLIVCPASVLYNWENEARKWLPGRTVKILKNKDAYATADVNIITYDSFTSSIDSLLKFKFHAVIFDESHRLKNYKTKRSMAAKEIAKKIPVRILLSGTPIVNKPKDLINQLIILDRINDLGGFQYFTNRYCDAQKKRFGTDMNGAKHLFELNKKLKECCMIRRLKKQVLQQLPDKIYMNLEVEIQNRNEYEKLSGDIISYIQSKAKLSKKVLKEAQKLPVEKRHEFLRQKTKEKIQKLAKSAELLKMTSLSRLIAEGKFKTAEEWIRNFIENSEEKLIVFVHHRDFGIKIAEKFDALLINGETSTKKRQEFVDRFQTNLKERLIILNLQAGSEGINLTAATHILFLELPFVPSLLDQAESRAHRNGQTSCVNIYYMIAKNTIEKSILKLLNEKRKIANAAINGSVFSDDSVLEELLTELVLKNEK